MEKHGFDGLVLDTGHMGMRARSVEQEAGLLRYYGSLASTLHESGRIFISVQPPDVQRCSAHDMQHLAAAGVDYVSIMTYDFSAGRGMVGPNSPLPWVRCPTGRMPV